MSKYLTILLYLAILPLTSLSRKMYIYIGQNVGTREAYKTNLYPDYNFPHTLILTSDFNCTKDKNCTIYNETKTDDYQGKSYEYREGNAQMNLGSMPFPESTYFRQVISNGPGYSVLGLQKASDFLEYFSKQNAKRNDTFMFQTDWDNNFLVKGDVVKTNKLPLDTELTADLVFYSRTNLPSKDLKFCVTNTLDYFDGKQSYFAVKKEYLEAWKKYANDARYAGEVEMNDARHNMTFYLYDSSDRSVGTLEFKFDELGSSGTNLEPIKEISPDFDQGRNCDIYTGTLTLRKFNFHFVYVEYDRENYDMLFGYETFHGYIDVPIAEPKHSHFEGEMWIYAFAFALAAFLVYYYVLRNKGDDSYYDDTNQGPDNGDDNQLFELHDAQDGRMKQFTFGPEYMAKHDNK